MERTGQSSLGIASLVISILVNIATFLALLVAGAVSEVAANSLEDAMHFVIGLFAIGSIPLNLASFGLGMAGIFQQSKGRACGVIGAVISLASIVVIVSLMVIGFLMG